MAPGIAALNKVDIPIRTPKDYSGENFKDYFAVNVSESNDSAPKDKKSELFTGHNRVEVDFARFYGIKPTFVDRKFDLILSDFSYLPKVNNPRADWVVTAGLNAFRAYQAGGFGAVRRFATIGTGSGTDVIAALDTFPELTSVALTDMHDEVVEAAKANVLSATEKADEQIKSVAIEALAKAGDLMQPLKGQKPYDIIYENLPNIPLPSKELSLRDGQASSTYVGDRTADKIPRNISAALLDLHYACLKEAKAFNLISRRGAILSSIGGRVTIREILNLATVAGYTGRILSFAWKEQSEPESVIGGYAENEKTQGREFYFYPAAKLEAVFNGRSPAGAGLCALQIEQELLSSRLTAAEALKKHRQGVRIGHTVVVMASTPY